MPWWGVLIIVVIAAVAAATVAWLIARRSNLALAAEKDLAEVRADTTAKKLDAERATKDKLENESRRLISRLREIDVWYGTARLNISKERRDAYTNLATDPDALDLKLNKLLGTSDPEDQAGEG